MNGPRHNGSRYRHGWSRTPIHGRWWNMIARCSIASASGWKSHGARGIRVCERWKIFENFLEDMGFPPTSSHTLERNDNDGDYTPKNCRWATWEEQQNNRRSNRRITLNGRTQTLQQWSKETGINRRTIAQRIDNGWSSSDALTTQVKKRG